MSSRLCSLVAIAVGLLVAGDCLATPLQTGSWIQIARMADGDGGMFNGNGDLKANYSFGTKTGDPLHQAEDFQIKFDVYSGMKILFMTGDETIWGFTSYSDLRNLIDAQSGNFDPNITFSSRINGVEQKTIGNVLSRGALEDPWIALQGGHAAGIANLLIIWGENDFSEPVRAALKNTHDGVNVFVSVPAIPVPAALPLFVSGLGLLGVAGWRRRHRAGVES